MQAIPVHYTISITDPKSHYANIEMEISGIKDKSIEVKMPVWTPGSYFVREFEKNVDGVQALSGSTSLNIYKTSKNTWKIDGKSALGNIKVTYRVYCFENSVRTSYIDNDRGFFILTSALMYTGNSQSQSGRLKLVYPNTWKKVSTTLTRITENEYAYTNYDELVDSPVEIGNHQELEFTVAGVPHKVAMVGANNCPTGQFTKDLQKVCETMYHIVGEHPCSTYLFFIHHEEAGGGGLEHANSCVVQMPRFNYSSPDKYRAFLSLCAHEYFHLWNVKRIRPIALGPFDYSRENYTNLLWVAEGITSYFDDLGIYRAGFYKQDEYIGVLNANFSATLNRIGARVLSLHELSADAWIREYIPTENSINTGISYYTKGTTVAALLDIEILSATDGKKGLDDLMQYLYNEFYKKQNRGFTDAEFYGAINTVAGKTIDIRDWVEKPNSASSLESMRATLKKAGCLLNEKGERARNYTGITSEVKGEKLFVKSIDAGSPGLAAGLQAGDELIALNNIRIKTSLDEALKNCNAGAVISVTISRGGLIQILELSVTASPFAEYAIQVEDKENVIFKSWLRIK